MITELYRQLYVDEEARTANMGLWQVGLTEVIEHQ